MSSVPAAIRVLEELQEVHLQLPIGKGVKMTPVPEAALIEIGLPSTQIRLQKQVKAARIEALDWMQGMQSYLTACKAAPGNMLVVSKLGAKMEEGRGLMARAHPEVSEHITDIFRHYDQGSEDASESDDWRRLCQDIGSCLLEIEKCVCLLEMRVVQATITLYKTTMRQLFTHDNIPNPISKMPSIMVNIQAALKIHPIGMQGCVIQGSGGLRIQGVQGESPFLYLCLWEPHFEGLRNNLNFNGNKRNFNFTSLTGKEIQAHIKLLAEKEQDVKSHVNTAQEMERMLAAFDQGIALFVPTTTMAGAAITANTLLDEMQQLSEDEKQESPFDIRVWNLEDGIPEGRIQALQTLIMDNKVSLVVSANEGQQDWTVYMAR
jgi:hypothetical protein